jgi:hypothetical protein
MTGLAADEQGVHGGDANASATDITQESAARLAGFLYLFLMVTGIIAQVFARGSAFASGDPIQSAVNITAAESALRAATALDLLNAAGAVTLAWALYLTLAPVGRPLALLAVFWHLVAAAGWAMLSVLDFATVQLLSGSVPYREAFDTHQVQVIAYNLAQLYGPSYRAFLLFYMLGAIPFAWLWFKSRYVPRPLALLGIAANAFGVAVTMLAIAVPALAGVLTIQVYGGPIFLFEVGLGFWLLIKGIRLPAGRGRPAHAP